MSACHNPSFERGAGISAKQSLVARLLRQRSGGSVRTIGKTQFVDLPANRQASTHSTKRSRDRVQPMPLLGKMGGGSSRHSVRDRDRLAAKTGS